MLPQTGSAPDLVMFVALPCRFRPGSATHERALARALRARHRVPSQDGGDLRSRQHRAAAPCERPALRPARPPRRAGRVDAGPGLRHRPDAAALRLALPARRRRRSQRAKCSTSRERRVPRRRGRPLHARAFRFLPVPRDAIATATRSSPAWAACTICRSRRSTFSSAWCAPGSGRTGNCCSRNRSTPSGRKRPPLVARWNAQIGDGGTRSADADGGKPRGADRRRRAAAAAGSASAFAAWSPRAPGRCSSARLPASAFDHVAMRYLHARYGDTGNVVAALWQAA